MWEILKRPLPPVSGVKRFLPTFCVLWNGGKQEWTLPGGCRPISSPSLWSSESYYSCTAVESGQDLPVTLRGKLIALEEWGIWFSIKSSCSSDLLTVSGYLHLKVKGGCYFLGANQLQKLLISSWKLKPAALTLSEPGEPRAGVMQTGWLYWNKLYWQLWVLILFSLGALWDCRKKKSLNTSEYFPPKMWFEFCHISPGRN